MKFNWLVHISSASWHGETVIFHSGSGDTFLYGEPAKGVLDFCISRESFSVHELVEISCDYFQDRRQAEEYVEAMLKSLIHQDLIISVAM